MLLSVAARLPHSASVSSSPREGLRWLHVVSIAYPVGGHTTMLRRWIELDDSGDRHDVVSTFMDGIAIPELIAAVAGTGGTVTTLGHEPSLAQRSRMLREIAWQNADRVVIHTHMWDIVPTVAFGVPGGPPVLFLNHADHTFWVGAAIADLLVNLRQSGLDLAESHRGIDRNFLFRIPLPAPVETQHAVDARREIRMQLNIPESAVVFLTVGAAFKYTAVGDLNFPAMVQKLLAELPDAYLIAIGPSGDAEGWAEAVANSPQRLLALGVDSATRYHPAADIYLEGFPFDSHTALLEAAVSGLPAVRIPANGLPIFSGHHFPLSVIRQPADVDEYLRQAVALGRSAELRESTAASLHHAVVGLQCDIFWRKRLEELRSSSSIPHSVHEVRSVDQDDELHRFWTYFTMRAQPVDPVAFMLHQARYWELDPPDYVQESFQE